jgi:hypothetical protein
VLIPNGDVACIVYYEVVLVSIEKLSCRQTTKNPNPKNPALVGLYERLWREKLRVLKTEPAVLICAQGWYLLDNGQIFGEPITSER